MHDRRHWESAVEPLLGTSAGRLWRRAQRRRQRRAPRALAPGSTGGRALKTDLFDEAMGTGLFRCSSVAATASSRSTSHRRCSPPRGALSGARGRRGRRPRGCRSPTPASTSSCRTRRSTISPRVARSWRLAHARAAARVLKPGWVPDPDDGQPPHPASRCGTRCRSRCCAASVGRLPGGRHARAARPHAHAARSGGFDILDMVAMLHCPRALAVRRARVLERRGTPASQATFLRRLTRWESLASLPTRYFTGHYVGCSRAKP